MIAIAHQDFEPVEADFAEGHVREKGDGLGGRAETGLRGADPVTEVADEVLFVDFIEPAGAGDPAVRAVINEEFERALLIPCVVFG